MTRRTCFRIDAGRREAFFSILAFQRHVATPPWRFGESPDPEDTKFLEVAATQERPVVVTGNLRHFPASFWGPVEVLSPAEAWGRLSLAG